MDTELSQQEIDYLEKYGDIPDEPDEILTYLENTMRLNYKKMEEQIKDIKALKWKELTITINMIPKPSARPRYSFKTRHFYVPNAGSNKKLIKKYINDLDIIYTNTELLIQTYMPTPTSSMTNNEIYLAEKGYISHMQDPDWDNLGKTYSDMIQELLILNDNLISRGIVEKHFSIKPRVVIKIRYQDGFDSNFNRRRITKSTSYNNLIKNKEESRGEEIGK